MIAVDDSFVALMRRTLGAGEAGELVASLDTEPVTGVRMNPLKGMYGAPPGLTGRPVPWCREGLVPDSRPRFTLMPQWHGGLLYAQEPSSMVIAEVARRLAALLGRDGLRYLDACAAPGGKTTAATGALPGDAFVVANELVPSRAAILDENLARWGAPNTAVCQGDTSAFRRMRESFDIVAVDAPCSGEGMMRKDEEARRQWSEGLTRQCAALQREIAGNVWEALRPGGFLIYSTCTFNRTENEDMLRHIADELGGECVDTGIGGECGIPGSLDGDLHAMRFMPHRTRGEGLFMGVMRKPGEYGGDTGRRSRDKGRKKPAQAVPRELPGLLAEPDGYVFSQGHDGCWQAIPKAHADLVAALGQATRVMSAGVRTGMTKGKGFVPDAALALSTAMSPGAYPHVEADLGTALSYLRGEAVTLPAGTPPGVVVITHAGIPLGFAKNLGNRANNMYPQAWRIRHL